MSKNKLMKNLKENFKLTLSHCKERITNNEKLIELEELSYIIVYKNGNRVNMFANSTYEEIKSIKTTNIIYIASLDDCETKDSINGHIDYEHQFDIIDKTINNLQEVQKPLPNLFIKLKTLKELNITK